MPFEQGLRMSTLHQQPCELGASPAPPSENPKRRVALPSGKASTREEQEEQPEFQIIKVRRAEEFLLLAGKLF